MSIVRRYSNVLPIEDLVPEDPCEWELAWRDLTIELAKRPMHMENPYDDDDDEVEEEAEPRGRPGPLEQKAFQAEHLDEARAIWAREVAKLVPRRATIVDGALRVGPAS